jgi:hypothetical protein
MKPAGDEHEDFELLDTYESEQGSAPNLRPIRSNARKSWI